MNLQRREEIREMISDPDKYTKDPDLRGALIDALAHIDTLEQTAAERVIADGKAPAVVVPPLTDEDLDSRCALHEDGESFRAAIARNQRMNFHAGYNLAASRVRAIPADRVLGEGMVAVDGKMIESAASFLEEYASRVPGISAVIAALRASQGGA